LREAVERAGLTCQVISRASSDRAADLVAEVTRIAPGAVVVGREDADLVDSLRRLGCDVLVPNAPLDDYASVRVNAGNSDSDLAAQEMGARLALYRDVPLVTNRRLSSRTERYLRDLGVDRTNAEVVQPAVSVGDGPGDTVTVHAHDRDRIPLPEALGGLARTEPIILLNSR
jgi:hypothetical protein